jgi:hypothetical protein
MVKYGLYGWSPSPPPGFASEQCEIIFCRFFSEHLPEHRYIFGSIQAYIPYRKSPPARPGRMLNKGKVQSAKTEGKPPTLQDPTEAEPRAPMKPNTS